MSRRLGHRGRSIVNLGTMQCKACGEIPSAGQGLALAIDSADPGRIANMRFVFGFALLWADRVDEALPVLSCSDQLGHDEYQGHSRAVLSWVHWRRGDSAAAAAEGTAALENWGAYERDGISGIGTEFSWLAVWPLAAVAADAERWDAAAERLRLVRVPWERPMPPDLDAAVDRAIQAPSPDTVRNAILIAGTQRLL